MKFTLFTTGKGDMRYMIFGILCALLLVAMIAARAKAEQSESVRVTQNGKVVFESDDYFGPEDFFSYYDRMFDDIDEPFEQIKELSQTADEFKTVIENENGGTTTVEHSNKNGEMKTVVEANNNKSNDNSVSHPAPSVTSSSNGIEIDGRGTCVKKQGDTTSVEAPNVKVHISGNGNGDSDIDIDSRVDNNGEKTTCEYNSNFDD